MDARIYVIIDTWESGVVEVSAFQDRCDADARFDAVVDASADAAWPLVEFETDYDDQRGADTEDGRRVFMYSPHLY